MTPPNDGPAPGTSDEKGIYLESRWPVGVAGAAVPINQVLLAVDQGGPDVIYMLLGHAAPPVWQSEAEAREHLEASGGHIAIDARGSFIMSRTRATEIWQTLGAFLGQLPPKTQ